MKSVNYIDTFHKPGNEVDLLIEAEQGLLAIEIKSSQTVASDFFGALEKLAAFIGRDDIQSILVYGGAGSQTRSNAQVIGWRDLQSVDWTRGVLTNRRATPKKAKIRR